MLDNVLQTLNTLPEDDNGICMMLQALFVRESNFDKLTKENSHAS